MDKASLRKEIKRRLSSLTDEYIKKSGEEIEKKIIGSDIYKACDTVFIYVSTCSEPSTRILIENALLSGKTVLVPRCLEKGVMEAVRITSVSDLEKGSYGISEPKKELCGEKAPQISLAVIPCMSAARDGRRLGHGGGYYDRFLEKNKPATMCLCFEKLMSDDIPVDAYDIKSDYVVNESEIIKT